MVANTAIEKKNDIANDDDLFRPGRPRSEKSRKAILDAARKLLMQQSMNELSIEAIAKKAKVGKTTIYRWWPSKAAVAMEAFLEQPSIQHVTPNKENATDSVVFIIESMIRQLRGHNGRIIAGIIAESQSDASVLDLMYERFLKDRVGALYDAIEWGQQNGEIRQMDLDIAVDMVLGPLFVRILSGDNGIDESFAERFPQQAVMALRV
jgi:AcrR family transcriptional regulator